MKEHLSDMNSKGYAFLGVQIKDEDIDWFAKDILSKKKQEVSRFGKEACVENGYFDIAKCLYNQEEKYEELLCSDWLNESVNNLVGENAIIYDVFGLTNLDQDNAQHRRNEWHRDQMFLGGIRASVLYFVPLVDFTEENGPTEVLSGSHWERDVPSDEECDSRSEKIFAKRGEVFVVDSSLVHRAGFNKSGSPRPALLIRYQLPFLIRQINLSRHYEKIKNELPDLLVQRFGFGLEFDDLESSVFSERPKNIYNVKYYES